MGLSATSPRTLLSPVAPAWVWRPYLVIFLVASAVGLAMVFVGVRSQSLVDTKFDPYYFGEMGKSLAHGDGLVLNSLLRPTHGHWRRAHRRDRGPRVAHQVSCAAVPLPVCGARRRHQPATPPPWRAGQPAMGAARSDVRDSGGIDRAVD